MLFDNSSNFYGDDTRWWYGIVQEVASDPLELGRARVRIAGIHGPEIEDENLPWAAVVLPTTSGGVSGIGTTPWLQPTARVFGIFLDGRRSQIPLVLGSVPAVEGRLPESNSGEAGIEQGVPSMTSQPPGITTNTNFTGSNEEAQATVTEYWRQPSPEEFRSLVSLTAAEASPDQLEQAWVAGVIINRSRARNKTIMQTANQPGQFHAVTGPGNGRSRYINGPSESRANSIYGSITNYLPSVPHDVYYFDSNVVGAYRQVGGLSKYNSVARDRKAAGLSLKVIGQSRFWVGGKF